MGDISPPVSENAGGFPAPSGESSSSLMDAADNSDNPDRVHPNGGENSRQNNVSNFPLPVPNKRKRTSRDLQLPQLSKLLARISKIHLFLQKGVNEHGDIDSKLQQLLGIQANLPCDKSGDEYAGVLLRSLEQLNREKDVRAFWDETLKKLWATKTSYQQLVCQFLTQHDHLFKCIWPECGEVFDVEAEAKTHMGIHVGPGSIAVSDRDGAGDDKKDQSEMEENSDYDEEEEEHTMFKEELDLHCPVVKVTWELLVLTEKEIDEDQQGLPWPFKSQVASAVQRLRQFEGDEWNDLSKDVKDGVKKACDDFKRMWVLLLATGISWMYCFHDSKDKNGTPTHEIDDASMLRSRFPKKDWLDAHSVTAAMTHRIRRILFVGRAMVCFPFLLYTPSNLSRQTGIFNLLGTKVGLQRCLALRNLCLPAAGWAGLIAELAAFREGSLEERSENFRNLQKQLLHFFKAKPTRTERL